MRTLIALLIFLFCSIPLFGLECVNFAKPPRKPKILGHLNPLESEVFGVIFTSTARFPQTFMASTLATWSFAVGKPSVFNMRPEEGFSEKDIQLVTDTKHRYHRAMNRGVKGPEDLGYVNRRGQENEVGHARRLLVVNFESLDMVAAKLRDFLIFTTGEARVSSEFQSWFQIHLRPGNLTDPLQRFKMYEILSGDNSPGVAQFRRVAELIHRGIMSHENSSFYEPWREALLERVRQFPIEEAEYIAENHGNDFLINKRYHAHIQPHLRTLDPFVTDIVFDALVQVVPTATRQDAIDIFLPWVKAAQEQAAAKSRKNAWLSRVAERWETQQ